MGESKYLIVWHDETTESKIVTDLLPFFEAMIKEMARHYPEKGDSWKTMSLYDLEIILSQHISDWWTKNKKDDTEDLVDLAALCGMVWSRKCADLRREE